MRSWLWMALMATGCGGGDDSGDSDTSPPETYDPTWDGMLAFMDDNCARCHADPPATSTVPKLPEALEADLRDGTGHYVVPGDLDGSWMWQLVSGGADPFVMPQDGLLPAESVAHVEQWILAGAPLGDANTDTDGGS
jgi:hypothetical protein